MSLIISVVNQNRRDKMEDIKVIDVKEKGMKLIKHWHSNNLFIF